MNKSRNVFHINSEGPKTEPIEEGLRWLANLAQTGQIKINALIIVNAKSVLDGVIASVIGEKAVKSLKDGKTVKLGSVATISVATDRTLPSTWDGPILAIYPSKAMLDKIDSLTGATDVLIIPWLLSEVEFWINTWSSNELGAPKLAAKKFNLHPILETALTSLSERVNLSTGLAHPSDRTATIQMFRVLAENHIPYESAEVRSWLVSKGGWTPSDADEVVEIGRGVSVGKRYHTKGKMWRDDIIDLWKEDAKKLGGGV